MSEMRIDRNTPRSTTFETHSPHDVEKKKVPAMGVLTHSKDQRILKTPEEIRKDSQFVIPPNELAKAPFETRELIHDLTDAACGNFKDNFSFERMLTLFYQAMFAVCERDQESLTEAVKGLQAESKAMSKERELAFREIYARMNRDKWFQWIQLGATALGMAAVATTPGAPLLAVTLASVTLLALQANSLLGNPLEKKLDGKLFSEEQWKVITSLVSLGAAVMNIYSSAGVATTGIADMLTKVSTTLNVGIGIATAVDQYQGMKDMKLKERLSQDISFNKEWIDETMHMLSTTREQFERFVKDYRQQLQMRAAAHQQLIWN